MVTASRTVSLLRLPAVWAGGLMPAGLRDGESARSCVQEPGQLPSDLELPAQSQEAGAGYGVSAALQGSGCCQGPFQHRPFKTVDPSYSHHRASTRARESPAAPPQRSSS